MSKTRPLSITIIAWLFLIVGLLSAWDVIYSLYHHRFSLNLGVLFIFLGHGLLRLRPNALSWALAMTLLGWGGFVLFAILVLCGRGEVRIHQEAVTGGMRWLLLSVVIILQAALLTWMTRVLTCKETEDLFREDS